MTHWTQKELDALVGVLQTHLSAATWNDNYSYLLVDARNRAHAASKLPLPSERTLSEIRTSVCGVCRNEQMYKCDVPIGWSMHCALLKSNSEPLPHLDVSVLTSAKPPAPLMYESMSFKSKVF